MVTKTSVGILLIGHYANFQTNTSQNNKRMSVPAPVHVIPVSMRNNRPILRNVNLLIANVRMLKLPLKFIFPKKNLTTALSEKLKFYFEISSLFPLKFLF